ncbi:MAG: hypothetical protein VB949_01050 [Pseudomonadales bacterium]
MQTRDGGYDVSVESPAGGAKEHIKLPFTVPEVLGKIREMSGTVHGAATRKAEFVVGHHLNCSMRSNRSVRLPTTTST